MIKTNTTKDPLFLKANGVIGWMETGSSVICNPPVLDTDRDYIIYTDNLRILRKELEVLGYTYSNKDVEKYKLGKTDPFQMYNSFDAYRHPDTPDNLIVMDKSADYRRWQVATKVATELNLKDKAQRIMLFRAIRSGGTLYQSAQEFDDE